MKNQILHALKWIIIGIGFFLGVTCSALAIMAKTGKIDALGVIVFVTLILGVAYIGFLANKKPNEKFLDYIGDRGSDAFGPFEENLGQLNRGQIFRDR